MYVSISDIHLRPHCMVRHFHNVTKTEYILFGGGMAHNRGIIVKMAFILAETGYVDTKQKELSV